jgi:hypothetical protein
VVAATSRRARRYSGAAQVLAVLATFDAYGFAAAVVR